MTGGRGARWAVGLVLAAITLAVFAAVPDFDFVSLDDPLHVTSNPHVRAGLSWAGVAWAVGELHAGYWIPLTWLSHMLDCALFGIDPAGAHATNLALHMANTLLLFGLLARATGRVGASGFAAALFAIHPLHVESVAWVTERKDVLSTFFGLLSTWAWCAWARRGGAARYAACAGLLAASLMAKPMLVTLPFVFLLLDGWPLGRLASARDLPRALREKLPLLAIAAAFCAVTFVAQRGEGAVLSTSEMPVALRAANAVVSYARYLGLALWPAGLSVLYPHPNLPGGTPWAAWQVAGATLGLLAVSALAWRLRSRRPYLLFGWLFYLGTLVPVLGLVQAGQHAMADRFTYVPLIGIFAAVSLAGADALSALARVRPRAAAAAGLAAAGLLAAYAAVAREETLRWRDSESLFRRSLAATPHNPVLLFYYGMLLHAEGRSGEAIARFEEAARIPGYAGVGHANIGFVLEKGGDRRAAARHYREALRAEPGLALAREGLARLTQERAGPAVRRTGPAH